MFILLFGGSGELMNKIINKYNDLFGDVFYLPYPKTDLQILKTYKFL